MPVRLMTRDHSIIPHLTQVKGLVLAQPGNKHMIFYSGGMVG